MEGLSPQASTLIGHMREFMQTVCPRYGPTFEQGQVSAVRAHASGPGCPAPAARPAGCLLCRLGSPPAGRPARGAPRHADEGMYVQAARMRHMLLLALPWDSRVLLVAHWWRWRGSRP